MQSQRGDPLNGKPPAYWFFNISWDNRCLLEEKNSWSLAENGGSNFRTIRWKENWRYDELKKNRAESEEFGLGKSAEFKKVIKIRIRKKGSNGKVPHVQNGLMCEPLGRYLRLGKARMKMVLYSYSRAGYYSICFLVFNQYASLIIKLRKVLIAMILKKSKNG